MGTTSSKQTNHKLDELLNIGATSKASIEKLLGRPDHKEVATSGYEYWGYTSQQIHRQPVKTFESNYYLKVWITPGGVLMDFEYLRGNS
jgi:hypothetical protein